MSSGCSSDPDHAAIAKAIYQTKDDVSERLFTEQERREDSLAGAGTISNVAPVHHGSPIVAAR